MKKFRSKIILILNLKYLEPILVIISRKGTLSSAIKRIFRKEKSYSISTGKKRANNQE